MSGKPFNLLTRVQSFKHALRGVWLIFKTQHNAWIHILAVVAVISLGIYTHLELNEWALISLAIGLVLVAELANTAIEFLGDAVTKEPDENIKNAKDVGAGTVLMAALIAVVIAGLVFIPKLIPLVTV